MGKKIKENKKEKWQSVIQLMRMLFTGRQCNMNVGGIKINRQAKVKERRGCM